MKAEEKKEIGISVLVVLGIVGGLWLWASSGPRVGMSLGMLGFLLIVGPIALVVAAWALPLMYSSAIEKNSKYLALLRFWGWIAALGTLVGVFYMLGYVWEENIAKGHTMHFESIFAIVFSVFLLFPTLIRENL